MSLVTRQPTQNNIKYRKKRMKSSIVSTDVSVLEE